MASLKDIRRRIQSVKNTRQITRAMKLVAAAKLRRAQEAVSAARPYSQKLIEIVEQLSSGDQELSKLLTKREEKKVAVVIFAGDRGLCGSFNSSLFKKAEEHLSHWSSEGKEVVISCVGKKSQEYFNKHHSVKDYYSGLVAKPDYGRVSAIVSDYAKSFLESEVDAVYLIFNQFKSAVSQVPTLEKLVPLTQMEQASQDQQEEVSQSLITPRLEPDKISLLESLLGQVFGIHFYQALLESVASEHGARMSAMESATKNASEMMDKLTLEYNKARQASITNELMEIVTGVEAMR